MDIYKSDILRNNGTDWLFFGEAVMGCAKRIEFCFLQNMDDEFPIREFGLNKNDPEFDQLLDWVRKQFELRLNFSPNEPAYKTKVFDNCITLFTAESAEPENILLRIPICAETVQRTTEDTLAKMQELTFVMKRIPRRY